MQSRVCIEETYEFCVRFYRHGQQTSFFFLALKYTDNLFFFRNSLNCLEMVHQIHAQEEKNILTDAVWPVKECTKLPSEAFHTHILQSLTYEMIPVSKSGAL